MALSKKKKRLLIITAALLVALAITATVLAVVKIGENKRLTETEYVTLEQLKKSVIPDKKYDNLDLSHAVLNMPQFTELYDIKWQKNANYTEEECITLCYEIGQKVLSSLKQNGVDMSTIFYCDDYQKELPDGKPSFDKVGATINFLDKTTLDEYYFTSYGFSVFDDNGTMQMYYNSPDVPKMPYVIRKITRLDLGQQPSDKMYRTIDGEMSEKQAIELAQQEVENYSKYLGGEMKPAYVYIYQYTEDHNSDQTSVINDEDNGNPYYFDVYFYKLYEGVPFFSSGAEQNVTEDDNGDYIFRQPMMYIEICESNCFKRVLSVGGYPVTNATKREEDKYISLQTACDKISELFAPEYELAIDEISFNYAMIYKFGDEDGSIHQAMPCWCFSTYAPAESARMMENTIYVDAVTGIVYFMTEGSAAYFSSNETDKFIR